MSLWMVFLVIPMVASTLFAIAACMLSSRVSRMIEEPFEALELSQPRALVLMAPLPTSLDPQL